jgi:site-specific recombinase XerD
MPRGNLEPIEPREAVEWYLEDRETEVSRNTIKAHNYRLNHFVRWCDEQGIENMNEIYGRDLQQYRLWRREDGDLNNVSMVTQLSTLRVFIRWCENIDAVANGVHDKIMLPSLSKNEDRRTDMLDPEDAKELIKYLRNFSFATRTHALVEVMWHTGLRIGAAHSLDVSDYKVDEQYLEIRHRPEKGTRLKNKKEGGRYASLTDEVCDVLDAYLQHNRINGNDEYGREPLFSTKAGRPNKTTLRGSIYRITRPCEYTGDCPHDREIKSCEAMKADSASKCPSSVSPHAIRRGAITHHLSKDVPEKIVSDRMNVGLDVLEKHYDRRTESEKAEQRRDYLDDL